MSVFDLTVRVDTGGLDPATTEGKLRSAVADELCVVLYVSGLHIGKATITSMKPVLRFLPREKEVVLDNWDAWAAQRLAGTRNDPWYSYLDQGPIPDGLRPLTGTYSFGSLAAWAYAHRDDGLAHDRRQVVAWLNNPTPTVED